MDPRDEREDDEYMILSKSKPLVMAALVAAIHAFVDARDKPGRDGCGGQGRGIQPNL